MYHPILQREHEGQAPDDEDVNEDFNQQEKFVGSFVIAFHRLKIKVYPGKLVSQKYPFERRWGVRESFFEGG